MAARFKAAPELLQAFAGHDPAEDGPLVAYRVSIASEAFTIVEKATFSEPAGFAAASFVGNSGGACYLLVQQPSRKLWTIVSYVPETSRVKDRMLYASGCARRAVRCHAERRELPAHRARRPPRARPPLARRESLKRELGTTHFYPRDIHCTEPDELGAACFVEDTTEARRKEYQGSGASADIKQSGALLGEALSAHPGGITSRLRATTLTDSERDAQSEQRSAAAASVGALGALMAGGAKKPTGAAVDFAASDEAKEALRALGAAQRGGLLLAIKAERLDVDGTLDEGSAGALCAALRARDPSEPSFALLRYRLAAPAEGGAASALVLLSFCPEGTAVRKRMIHASAKPALRSLLAELELEVAKSLETQDLDDLTDGWLSERVGHGGPSDAADGGVARRPAPKGGRRVMRRAEDQADE